MNCCVVERFPPLKLSELPILIEDWPLRCFACCACLRRFSSQAANQAWVLIRSSCARNIPSFWCIFVLTSSLREDKRDLRSFNFSSQLLASLDCSIYQIFSLRSSISFSVISRSSSLISISFAFSLNSTISQLLFSYTCLSFTTSP